MVKFIRPIKGGERASFHEGGHFSRGRQQGSVESWLSQPSHESEQQYFRVEVTIATGRSRIDTLCRR